MEIREIHTEHKGTYGVRRVHAELRGFGHTEKTWCRRRGAAPVSSRCSWRGLYPQSLRLIFRLRVWSLRL
ncbi:IS3 family transposase [Streptomyces sp. SID625]|nr:IS3 family transposase [Streptomyces sp. SID625]